MHAYDPYDDPYDSRDRYETDEETSVNVGRLERAGSAAVGAALIAAALQRRWIPGMLMGIAGAALVQRGITGHCALYDRLSIDTRRRRRMPAASDFHRRGVQVEESITVQKPVDEVYSFWRDFTNFPRFMQHLERVERIDDRRSRWTAKAPAGRTVSWDAEIINEEPNRVIAWQSLEDADVDNRGSVRFRAAPGGRGTEVKVTLVYLPPAGKIGVAIAKLSGEDPASQVRDDLRRFRQIMEVGEVPVVEGQPTGRTRAWVPGRSAGTDASEALPGSTVNAEVTP